MPGHLTHRLDHLSVGEPGAVAQIEDPVRGRLHGGQREQVRGGQVGDVDVVAYAGAVRRRVVVSEDLEFLPNPGGDLQRDRDQVGLRVVPLTHQYTIGGTVRPGHVE